MKQQHTKKLKINIESPDMADWKDFSLISHTFLDIEKFLKENGITVKENTIDSIGETIQLDDNDKWYFKNYSVRIDKIGNIRDLTEEFITEKNIPFMFNIEIF